MLRLRRVQCAAVVLITIAAAAMAWADRAGACSCADRDERDRLEDGEIGVVGEVLERRTLERSRRRTLDGQPLVAAYEYRVRVQRGVGARFGSRATVRVPDDGCGDPKFEVGERLAAFVRKRSYGWLTHGCSVVDPAEFERALRPYPRGRGHGRLALLAGGRFGDARVMALDDRGRILGYGFGAGEVQQISVCPSAQLAAEVVAGRTGWTVAARDLRSLRVVWSVKLPMRSRELYPGAATVRCADAVAGVAYAAAVEALPRSSDVLTRIFSVGRSGSREIAAVRGYGARLGRQAAYLTDSKRLLAVGLADGGVRRLSRLAYFAEPLAESPDGRWLAFHDGKRLRLRELGTGRVRSTPMRFGGAIVWLSNDRFLFRRSGQGRVYDTELRLRRRYPFFRLYHQAYVGGRLFGMDRFELRSLSLGSGRRHSVARLPDRGIAELVGVPGGPDVDADPAAPGLGFAPVARRASACRPPVRG
jgi:hypothetical protein